MYIFSIGDPSGTRTTSQEWPQKRNKYIPRTHFTQYRMDLHVHKVELVSLFGFYESTRYRMNSFRLIQALVFIILSTQLLTC